MKVAIIGAGFTGLTAGLRLLQKGYKVTIFEKNKYCGGLGAGFKEKNWNWSLENFFHHLFTSDTFAKKLISELDLSDKLFYLSPKTSIFYKEKIFQFDSPVSVLKFSPLSPQNRIRTGLVTLHLKMTNSWQKLENISAEKWLKNHYGNNAYRLLWQPLLKSKFGNQASKISMSWFWARIKKRSKKLGYLKGGFQILINTLVQRIKKNGGQIILDNEVIKIISQNGKLCLQTQNSFSKEKFEKIIITTPQLSFFKNKMPPILGAINLILILKEQFLNDGTYWLNINEKGFPFVAIVEHTNFISPKNYGGDHIIYVGGYYPQNHRYFKISPKEVLREFLPFLKKVNPKFNFQKIINYKLSANLYAQPIIPVGYSKILPPFTTKISNVLLANMQMVYPWDRGINYAIELGEKVTSLFDRPD